MSDRDAFRENRTAGLRARHETREARAIRKQVAEEIAEEANRLANEFQESAVAHRDLAGNKATPKQQRHWQTALAFRNKADGAWAVAAVARESGAQE